MKRKDILPVLLTGALSASTFANTLTVFAQEEQPQEINRGVSETNADQVNEPTITEETETVLNTDNDSQNTLTEQPKESEESNENSNSISSNNTSKIESIDSKQELKLDDKQTQNVVNVTINGTTTGYTNINDAFAVCNGQTATITLLDNVTSTNPIVVNNANITFVGGDFQLYSYGESIDINNSTFTLEGGYINHDGLSGFVINSGSKLIMNGGKVNYLLLIQDQNVTCDLHGGVIEFLDGFGTVNVYSGTIQNIDNYYGSINYYYTSPTPTYNVSTTKDSITVNLTNYDSIYGFVGYAISKEGESPNGWQQTDQSTIEFTGNPNQNYTISLYYKGDGNYLASEVTTFTVSTKKDISGILNQLLPPTGLTAVYDQKLSDVELPTGWSWVNPNTVLNETDGLLIPGEPLGIGEFEFPAQLDVSQYDSQYDFSGQSDYYDSTNHVLNRDLTVLVSAKQNTISLEDGFKLEKTYDAKPVKVTEENIKKAYDAGTVTFEYQEEKISGLGIPYWSDLAEAPTKVGKYQLLIHYDGGTWYASDTVFIPFEITKADTILSFIQTNIDKTYDGKKAFVSTDQKGNSNAAVKTWYQLNEDGTETPLSSAPVNVGKYKVVATVDPNENYNGAQIEMIFEIFKAVPSYTVPSGLAMKQGDTLSSLALPEGFTWKDGSQKADTLGTQTFKATYTPTDTTNYQTVDVEIPVEVVSATIPENQAPVINAKDQTLTVGDKFDPMKGVTATDKEDGDLTDKIVITKNTVDTSKAGKYTVDYEVTDNGGTRVRKTIVVTVKEKSAEQTTTTTDSKKTNATKTSAGLGIGLFSSLAGASAVGAGILSVLKKRNGK